MDDTAIATRPVDVDERSETTADTEPELIDELLVEEISIDGMCGVY